MIFDICGACAGVESAAFFFFFFFFFFFLTPPFDCLLFQTLATRGFEFSSTPHIPADDYEDEVEAEETMEVDTTTNC